ncbi:hypothetical protein [uncultured Pseudoteredinibacter sp.]|uniref:hypothetical protein n=1 Tax=uncultured Pseudoteredinibacter sp. TaxID=1641701 RepID=UPI00260E1029|nr:hypothetical protein [uncultured Pseudoteredinibacter sp.]
MAAHLYIYIKPSVEWLVYEDGQVSSSGCLNMAHSSINRHSSQPLQALLPSEFSSLPCHVIIASEHSICLSADLSCSKRNARAAAEFALQEFSSVKTEELLSHCHSNRNTHSIEAIDREFFDKLYQSLDGLALVDVYFDYQLLPQEADFATALCLGSRLIINQQGLAKSAFQRQAYSVHQSWAQAWWSRLSKAQTDKLKIYGCLEEFSKNFSELERQEMSKNAIDIELCSPCEAADLEQLLCFQHSFDVKPKPNSNLLNSHFPALANSYRLQRPAKPLMLAGISLSVICALFWGSQLF